MDLFASQVPGVMTAINLKFAKKNLQNYLEFYGYLRAYYENDFELIKDYLFEEMKCKKIISNKTLIHEVMIGHIDIIQKALKRNAAGITDEVPTIELQDKDGNVNQDATEYLSLLLDKLDFFSVIKSLLLKALFFNVSIGQPIWRDSEMQIDELTPDMFTVLPKDDFYKIRKIFLPRVSYNEDGTNENFTVVWSDTEHYKLGSDGKPESIGNNKDNKNPYNKYPGEVLRIKKGSHFLGEPNNNLFTNQVAIDMKVSGIDKAVIYQSNQWTLLTNVPLPLGTDGKPELNYNQVLSATHTDKEQAPPDVKNVKSEIQIDMLNDDVENRIKLVYSSEGLPATSASLDTKAVSGLSKIIDELEVQENRETLKSIMYDFAIRLLKSIIMVNNVKPRNYKNDDFVWKEIPKDLKIHFQLNEAQPQESELDKTIRREREIKFKQKTPIDFIMEDEECTQKEAEEIYTEKKEWYDKNGFGKPAEDKAAVV